MVDKNKFFQEHQVILKTKIGWHVVYKKLDVVPPFNNQVIKCSNNERYSALTGRQIGTSTPDYIYRLDDKNEDGLTYKELYDIQQSVAEAVYKTSKRLDK
jgi:hypothetical protein